MGTFPSVMLRSPAFGPLGTVLSALAVARMVHSHFEVATAPSPSRSSAPVKVTPPASAALAIAQTSVAGLQVLKSAVEHAESPSERAGYVAIAIAVVEQTHVAIAHAEGDHRTGRLIEGVVTTAAAIGASVLTAKSPQRKK